MTIELYGCTYKTRVVDGRETYLRIGKGWWETPEQRRKDDVSHASMNVKRAISDFRKYPDGYNLKQLQKAWSVRRMAQARIVSQVIDKDHDNSLKAGFLGNGESA